MYLCRSARVPASTHTIYLYSPRREEDLGDGLLVSRLGRLRSGVRGRGRLLVSVRRLLGRDGHGVLDDGLHSEGERDGWLLRGAQGPWREFCILLVFLHQHRLSIYAETGEQVTVFIDYYS